MSALFVVACLGIGVGYWLTIAEKDVDQLVEPVAEAPEPAATVEPPTRGLGNLGAIKASRLFAGPEQFPPKDFAAYGIVAFRALATAGEHERHVMLCAAYIAALPRSDELGLPVEQQMVTVWPISDTETADELNKQTADELNEQTADERNEQTADERNKPRWPVACEKAISRYGLAISLQALRDAGEGRIRRDRRGPFLLAWAPASDKGKKDALILVADLSNVTTASQAEAIFVHWRNDIEANPDLWGRGWAVDRLRLSIQHWVDRFGPQIFSMLGD